jgi:hypothetical protein
MPARRRMGIRENAKRTAKDNKGLSTTVLKPVAPRLAETSWPTPPASREARASPPALRRRPSQTKGSTPVGAAVEKRDRHDERQRSRSIAEESLRRDIPVPAAKQDLQDAAAQSRDSPEAGRWSGRVSTAPARRRRRVPALAFGQTRVPESRSAVRLPRTSGRRLHRHRGLSGSVTERARCALA